MSPSLNVSENSDFVCYKRKYWGYFFVIDEVAAKSVPK